eukprot:14803914-Alexandrium_andersonii.AAC.1
MLQMQAQACEDMPHSNTPTHERPLNYDPHVIAKAHLGTHTHANMCNTRAIDVHSNNPPGGATTANNKIGAHCQ